MPGRVRRVPVRRGLVRRVLVRRGLGGGAGRSARAM
jgi:hypothetical protein